MRAASVLPRLAARGVASVPLDSAGGLMVG